MKSGKARRKKQKRKTSQRESGPPPTSPSETADPTSSTASLSRGYQFRKEFCLVCFTGLLLGWAASPLLFIESFQLAEFPDLTLLGSERVWTPPLAEALAQVCSLEIPAWVAVLGICSGLAACLLVTRTGWMSTLALYIGVAGLALLGTRDLVLLDVACLGSIVFYLHIRDGCRPLVRMLLLFLCVLVVCLGTIEFGLMLFALFFGLLSPSPTRVSAASNDSTQPKETTQSNHNTLVFRTRLLEAFGLVILSVAMVSLGLLPGTVAVRPLSWMWLDIPEVLLTSVQPIWHGGIPNGPRLLVILFVVERWCAACLGRLHPNQLVLLSGLTLLGAGCVHYFWLCSAAILAIVSNTPFHPRELPTDRSLKLLNRLSLAAASVILGVQIISNFSTILGADLIRKRLDYSQWNFPGVVLVMDLDDADYWQRPAFNGQYRPVLSDRWEVFGEQYPEYEAICEDWRNWRREAYLRKDASWGGYQQIFTEWNPRLVAANTRDLSGLHRVSLDSQWKAIGLDPTHTIFARPEDELAQSFVNYAQTALATMELPRPGRSVDFDRVVARGTADGSMLVSRALTALRFPFAGLRVLPPVDQPAVAGCRVFAWSELAHRTHRYSGKHSLLDCARVFGWTKSADLGKYSDFPQRYLVTLQQLISNDLAAQDLASVPSPSVQNANALSVRGAILRGNLQAARKALTEIPSEPEQAFFRCLLSLPKTSTMEAVKALASVQPELESPSLASECAFYEGCLSIELGDYDRAIQALERSLEIHPSHSFANLANFYLSQLKY